MKGISAQ